MKRVADTTASVRAILRHMSTTTSPLMLHEQRWLPCGEGTLCHPVTFRPVSTRVVELDGFGRIGEWLDYSGDPERTFAAIVNSPEALAHLRQAALFLSVFVKDGQPNVPPANSAVWQQIPAFLEAVNKLVARVEAGGMEAS